VLYSFSQADYATNMPIDPAAITRLEAEIAELEQLLSAKKRRLEELSAERLSREEPHPEGDRDKTSPAINNLSPPEVKIALFRALFKGREDVYANRCESKKTGKSGYQEGNLRSLRSLG
jgi:hypothetical protein